MFKPTFSLLLIFVFLISSCGSGQKGVSSTYEQPRYNNAPAQTGSEAIADADLPKTRRGTMNGVAYVINQDLKAGTGGDSFDRNSTAAMSPSFQPAVFETDSDSSSSRGWRPRKGYDIPMVRNAKVERWIKAFNGPLRKNFTTWLARAGRYGGMIEDILKEYGLPRDLIYLAMIESGMNVNAYSHAHAAGAWQFIRTTGQVYGLRSGGYVDERRDIEKATRAAAAHLRDLYREFGDWYLAFGAYNAGAGGINRAIKRSGSRDFWKIAAAKKLHPETADYVPRILAAAIIAKNYKHYGFSPVFQSPHEYETAAVDGGTDLSTIAQCAQASYEDIKTLNAPLVMGMTPPGQRYTVKLPKGTCSVFKANYAKLPAGQRTRVAYHKVKAKETLATIAKRYGISTGELASVNGLKSTSHPKVGSRLKIPNTIKIAEPVELASAVSTPIVNDEPQAVSGEDALDPLAALPQGGEDEVEAPAAPTVVKVVKTHKVKKGDTLQAISRRYGLSVASIKSLNRLKSDNVRIGTTLKVGSSVTQVASAAEPVSNQAPVVTPISTINNNAPVEQENADIWTMIDSGSGEEKAAAPAVTAPIVADRVYVVQPGDSLWKIASSFGVTVDELVRLNPSLEKGKVKSHQRISIPSAESVGYETASAKSFEKPVARTANTNKKIVHTVRRGETLWKVSQKYKVTINQIKSWNKIKNTNLIPNQKLVIYSGGAVAQR